MTFPKVTKDDNGIRLAGKQDQCFYCHSKIGEDHGKECVTVTKRVRLKMTVSFDVEVPYYWDQSQIEFHRNESSWCANNAIRDLTTYTKHGRCLCFDSDIKYVETIDETPLSVKEGTLRLLDGEKHDEG